MAERREFEAEIQEGHGGGAFVTVPFDVLEAFGSRRPKVRATFDGHDYRGSIAPMGGPSVLGIAKEIRKAIGKQLGDRVRVTVELDTDERVVEVPADLAAALDATPAARAAFDRLSYTHRKEHARAVAEAKRPETRQRRIEQTLKMLIGDGGA